jgi:hypothetical protein
MFNALPGAGGILDQNPYLMHGMAIVIQARQARYEKDHPKPKVKM